MPETKKARAVGFNHIPLEVGDIEEALAFYGRLFDFKLRGKSNVASPCRFARFRGRFAALTGLSPAFDFGGLDFSPF